MSNTGDGTQPAKHVHEPRDHWWSRLIAYPKRKFHERRAKKQQESPSDRAARRTANATIWMAIFTVILAFISIGTLWILKNQLREMHEGGIDTHALAEATKKMKESADRNASAAERFAGSADGINTKLDSAVGKLNDQAGAMKDLAGEAKTQAQEAKVAADAAKSAADTAVSGLRPWIKITDVKTRGEGPEIPALSFQHGPTWPADKSQATLQLQISFKNVGRSPAKASVIFELFLPVWKNGYSDVVYQEKRRFCGGFAKKNLGVTPLWK